MRHHLRLALLALVVAGALAAGAAGAEVDAAAEAEVDQGKPTQPPPAQQREPNYGPAKGCIPPTLPRSQPESPPVPALPAGRRPNFIIVLTDDQGYDDIGLHQPQKPGGKPQWVSTPNLDRFMRGGESFSNFYVSPMCSQSRAELLTGRSYQRTGTMLINGGFDYINRDEATFGRFMAEGGYKTAHFGKWHNGRTLGYEPWEMGFQESWLPSSHVHLDNLMRRNGAYVQTQGLMEQDLMDSVLAYLQRREDDGEPFILYYAPHAIHQGFMRPGQGPRWQRPAPEPYKSKYKNMTPKLAGDTAEVWAMLEYMDDVLGRLFEYYAKSKLRSDTFLMVMSDNGAELFPEERRGYHRARRIPSGMQGFKKSVEEGGIRNYLAVQGPGVPAGVVDDTLLSITDVLPTVADLSRVHSSHLPWDGMSFADLLRPGAAGQAGAVQAERFVFEMSPHCWSPDSVPELGDDRRVLKPQPLLEYDRGGVDGAGFKRCIGGRHKEFKWLGDSGRVFRIVGDNHIELPCNEVKGEEKQRVVDAMEAAARAWWKSILDEPHSFSKPTFQLGLGGWAVTNVLPDGAHSRTPGRVELLPNGAAGFSRIGDSMCFAVNVAAEGNYKVTILYTSRVQAQFRLSVGDHAAIKDGSAPSLLGRLPIAGNMRGFDMGSLRLQPSNGRRTEICLEMVASTSVGAQVFDNLANIRFTLEGARGPANTREARDAPRKAAVVGAAALPAGSGGGGGGGKRRQAGGRGGGVKPGSLLALDWITPDSPLEGVEDEALHPHLAATPAMRQAERDAYAAAASKHSRERRAAPQPGPGAAAPALAWHVLRAQYLWPDGQGAAESLFSPYESEGIDMCAACQPDL